MNLKVRDRTNEELLVRKKEFLKICDILDSLKINFFLNSGILLGAVRDNDFIKWDWDIEISVFSNEFLKNIDLISENLGKSGFEIVRIIRNENNSKIDFIGIYPANVTNYTIYAWQYSKLRKVFWRKELSIPSKFLKKLSTFEFLGRKFNCPNYLEEYLSFVYGNWKKPIRTANKKVYLTKFYKKETLYHIILIEKIFNTINIFLKKLKLL